MPPASRHLWVGNLPHSITDADLAHIFSRFGEITRIAFLPGRSYAFIDLGSTDEAVAAMKGLDGAPVDGNLLRVEFTKVEKSSASSHDEEYTKHRERQRSSERPISHKDSKFRRGSPDQYHPDKPRTTDKSSESEPSEVLWVGFPAQLRVDETILRKAFSPFGEIEKITAFPGRTYAFIRFRDLVSACRAKETLQGKLFGNPRVNICFARSESGGGSIGGKISTAAPLSPQLRPRSQDFGGLRSPRFASNLELDDRDIYGVNRRGVLRSSADRSFGYEPRRFGDERSDVGLPHAHELHDSPRRDKRSNFSYSSQKNSDFEPWDLPEETDLFPGSKRPRTSAFPPDNELSEYDFADLKRERLARPRVISDFVQSEPFDQKAGHHLRYQQMNDRFSSSVASDGEKSDRLRAYHDNVHTDSISMGRNRLRAETNAPSMKEWMWEGTIAKGGSPICRARCLPVGKALDMMLPEFLDCTARTSLDMLSKHYYQAASSWVVFFVPGSDADMGFYNEFMHYLEEKQRAAVAKLDDRTTMFLVPPSDFSQKVLKVAGNLSISGVILRLENPPPVKVGSLHRFDEVRERRDLPELVRSGREIPPYSAADMGTSLNPAIGQSLSSQYFPSSTSGPRKSVPLQVPSRASGLGQEMTSSDQFHSGSFNFPPGNSSVGAIQDTRAPNVSSVSNPELLAQLASSLFGQQRQTANALDASTLNQNWPENMSSSIQEMYNLSNTRGSSDLQPYQPQHQLNFPAVGMTHQGNQQVASTSGQQEGDNDPQKRLQATLQLAAALLQQIQQGK